MSAKGCLVTIGVVGIIGVAGFAVLFKTGKGLVEDFASGIGVSPKLIKEAQDLNRKFEFEKPGDNRISENQLKKFISIKKDFAGKFNEHRADLEELGDRPDRETGFAEAREAYKILGEIRHDFLKSLRKNEMSPREYAFLTAQIYDAYFVDAAKKSYQQASEALPAVREQMKQQMKTLQKQLDNPNVTKEVRESLEQAMAGLQETMQQAQAGSHKIKEEYEKLPEQNIKLLNKYRSELEKLNTLGFEYWGLAMGGYE